jgi:hypothetical protein
MFMAILVLLGIVSAWIGVNGYRQLTAIQEIERLKGHVTTEPAGPKWLRDQAGRQWNSIFDNVVAVSLGDQAADDTLRRPRRFNGAVA